MRVFYATQILALCLALLLSCGWSGSEEDARTMPEAPTAQNPVAGVVNKFGAELLEVYRETNPNGNIVFSPLSLVTAFYLLYRGSAGTTEEALEAVFGFGEESVDNALADKPDQLNADGTASIASRLYVDTTVMVKETYKDIIGSERIADADFGADPNVAREDINDWVSDQTGGLIPDLIGAGVLTPATLMVLVNALYFRGTWKTPFPVENTEEGTFYGLGGEQKVPFMMLKDVTLTYMKHDDLDGIMFELPYSGEVYSMYIFLPDKTNGWERAEMRWENYGPGIFDAVLYTRQQVATLKMPKWELESSLTDLKSMLTTLGLGPVFTSQTGLTGISDELLQVDDVVHRAKIIVDEEGTEAAAATAILTVRSAVAYPAVNITVNHPFLYFIVSNSDRTVLFQGTQTSI